MFVGTVAKLAESVGISADYMLGIRDARTMRERDVEQEAESNWRFERRRRRQ
jgi:hypothetical protein